MTSCDYYYCSLLLLFCTKYVLAYSCYDCDSMYFNYSITIDNLPSPTRNDCRIITANTGCFVRIDWLHDQTSAVLYGTNLGSPIDSVEVRTERYVTLPSYLYFTHKYAAFICGSLNSEPCNTVEDLKRVMISTTLPNDEQFEQYDQLIAPTNASNSSLCWEFRNMTDNCAQTDFPNCQQCLIGFAYSQETNICAICSSEEPEYNYVRYDTRFFLNNRTRSDFISIGCQQDGICNSMKNIEEIRKSLMSKFDFDKFFYSTASFTKSSLMLLLIPLLALIN